MIHDVGRRILIQAEQKYGKLAIPHLLRWIAGIQLFVFFLGKLDPALGESMVFNLDKILTGEVWRLISWVFMPRASNPLFIIIATMFMFFVSDSLENAWESFRVNVYVVVTILLLIVGSVIIPLVFPLAQQYEELLYTFMNIVFYSAVFLAFATIFPNQIIHLMMIIPIKVKWLGFANAAILLVMIMGGPIIAFSAILGLLPYLLVFGPTFFQTAKLRSDNATRRTAFREKIETSDAFHNCHICGKTEMDDPHLEFRVAADGEEYCVEHLPKRAD